MRGFCVALALAALVLGTGAANAGGIKAYKTLSGAEKHCPGDEIVWANPNSKGVFHVKGTKFYGHTKDGAYVCRKEAEDGGWHEAKNKQ